MDKYIPANSYKNARPSAHNSAIGIYAGHLKCNSEFHPLPPPSGPVCVIRVVRQSLGAVCVVCIAIHVVSTVYATQNSNPLYLFANYHKIYVYI